jgi:hypothetical protein
MKTLVGRIKEKIKDAMQFYEIENEKIIEFEAHVAYVDSIKTLIETIRSLVDSPAVEEIKVEMLVRQIIVKAIDIADKEHKKEVDELMKKLDEDES